MYPYGYELIVIRSHNNKTSSIYISSKNNYETRESANRHRLLDCKKEITVPSKVEVNILTKKTNHDPYILIAPLYKYLLTPLVGIVAEYNDYKPIVLTKIITGYIRSSCIFCSTRNCMHGLVGSIPQVLEFTSNCDPRFICTSCTVLDGLDKEARPPIQEQSLIQR